MAERNLAARIQWENRAVPQLNETPPAKSYQAVLSEIENQLREGKLKVGDQLPGERALASSHGISRASVRDAIRVLDAMGVVRTSTGSGPNAGAVVIANPAAGLGSTLRLHMATQHFPVADIVQTRVMMETWAAQEAAQKSHDPAAIEQAENLLLAMNATVVSRDDFHAMDAQYHVLLSSLAGNAVITSMMESLRFAVQSYVAESITGDQAWEKIVPTLRDQHQEILAAVKKNDGGAAASALRHHIEWFHSQTQSSDVPAAQS